MVPKRQERQPPQPVRRLWIPSAFALLLWLAPQVATAQNGLVSGSVADADFGVAVSNASVTLEQSGQSATTDKEGRFVIENVPPGAYTITISSEGFVTERYTDQVVTAGAVTRLSLNLTAQVVELDTYVPPPDDFTEETTLGSLEVKSTAAAIQSVLGAEFLAQAGASDAGEALTKVSGASVADSKYVVIRGLSDRYNVVVLNGARIPSSDPDRRAVNIDIFPGNLIENLVVQKTFSPELPGETTGGYVNVVTKAIPAENFAKISYGLAYNTQATGNDRWVRNRSGGGVGFLGTHKDRSISTTLMNTPTDGIVISNRIQPADGSKASDLFSLGSVNRGTPPPDFKFSASAGARGEFMGSPAGVVGAVSYSKKYRYDPNKFIQSADKAGGQTRLQSQFLVEEGKEELLVGALFSAGWQPRGEDLVKFTYFGNVAAEDLAQYAIGTARPIVDSETGIEDGGDIFSLLGDAAGGRRAEIMEREVSRYVERQLHTLQLSGQHFFDDGQDEFNWVLAYSRSFQDEPELKITNIKKLLPLGRYEPIDSDFFGSPIDRIWRRIEDGNYFVKLDHAMQLFGEQDEGGSARLHFGGSFDESWRDFRADTFSVSTNRTARNFPPAPENDAADAVNLTYTDNLTTFLDDPSQLGPGDSVRRIAAPDIYEGTQTTLGGFFSATAKPSDGLNATFGLRVEDYQQYIDAERNFLPNSYPSSVRAIVARAPNPVVKAQTDFMPHFSTLWEATEDLSLSAAFSRTVARPSFKEVAPIALRVIGDPGQFFVGNPDLESSTISNYDVRLEWNRPDRDETYALAGFSKLIDKPIEFRSGSEFDTFANTESGYVWGWELEASKGFDDIALLQNVTLSGNFAQIFSGVEILRLSQDWLSRRSNGLDTERRLQGQPDYILNFNAVYDNEDLGLFMGLFLNVTGELLTAAGSGSPNAYELDTLQRPLTTLDFGIGKEFGPWKVSLRAENLLNARREEFYSDGTLRRTTRGGRTYSISISGSF